MSSIKRLKKEINCLTEQFASDGFGMIAHHPDKREEVIGLISDAIILRNNQIYRLNHLDEIPEGSSPRRVIGEIKKEFFGKMNDLFGELSKVTTAPEKKSRKKSPAKTKKAEEEKA
jgi:hypothetical protein